MGRQGRLLIFRWRSQKEIARLRERRRRPTHAACSASPRFICASAGPSAIMNIMLVSSYERTSYNAAIRMGHRRARTSRIAWQFCSKRSRWPSVGGILGMRPSASALAAVKRLPAMADRVTTASVRAVIRRRLPSSDLFSYVYYPPEKHPSSISIDAPRSIE